MNCRFFPRQKRVGKLGGGQIREMERERVRRATAKIKMVMMLAD